MNINSVNKSASLYSTQEQKAIEKRQDEQNANSGIQRGEDKLELSSQARQLTNVQQRIEQGFYDRPEVLRSVARKINEEISAGDEE
jgi:anti-sigma28 factor (negative regulator of flagellin synthesis)